MRILISNDSPNAHYFIRMGLARAFTAAGHEVIMWDITQKPVFDAFDEFRPDLFIGQTYNINESLIQCIEENPALKVVMKAGDWGPLGSSVDTKKFPMLQATEKEIQLTKKLQERTGRPDFLYIHYHEAALDSTHGQWRKEGFTVHSMLNAADVFEYTNGQRLPEFESDLSFIGGYWGYKAQVLDEWLLPFCAPDVNYNVKIFGNSPWPVPQYCGFIDGRLVNDMLASATICPNLSEPHSQVFGFDIIERPFKLLANKCFVISDYVELAATEVFTGDEIVWATCPQEFKELVDYYLDNPEVRQQHIDAGYNTVINNHTYFHRVAEMLCRLNLKDAALGIDQTRDKVFNQLHLLDTATA